MPANCEGRSANGIDSELGNWDNDRPVRFEKNNIICSLYPPAVLGEDERRKVGCVMPMLAHRYRSTAEKYA